MGGHHRPAARDGRAPATDGLLVLRDSAIHRLPSHGKIVALVAFVLVVVATPAGAWSVFGAYGVLITLVVALAHAPVTLVMRRALVETPFVVFAVLLPFVATGPTVRLGPLSLSHAGLVGGGTLLAKATLGVVAAIVLAATTAPRDLPAGLERLRLPRVLVAIMAFMVRYASVVSGDVHRMRVARESRGYTGGRVGHLGAVAGGAGSLFVRTYERGERVHQAMLARGFTGAMPTLATARATPVEWVRCAMLPLAALGVLATQLHPAHR